MNYLLEKFRGFYFVAVITAVALLILSTNAMAEGKAKSNKAMIKDALKAAPKALSKEATIKDWDGNVLRKGTGNYTCFPTPPNLKGLAPMCLDNTWLTWADAWQNKKSFEISNIGTAYMLAGDEGASNTDPYAAGETKDNQWIEEGPHLMVIVPDSSLLSDIPTDPHNGGPYVMWKGTPYAHIMVPVAH